MLIISDGCNTGVSGTFPFPYSVLPTIKFFDTARRFSTALMLIFLEVILCFAFIFLLVTNPEPTGLTAFSFGFPSLLICLKYFTQKMTSMKRGNIKIVGVAPKRIWIEHLLLCLALGLGGLWANKMQDFDLLGFTFYTVIVLISIIGAIWPFLNFALYKSSIDPEKM